MSTIAIPKEVKNNEFRVAITPIGVRELVARSHEVVIEAGAGVGSQISDEQYVAAGAQIAPDAESTWGAADIVLKVKEPIEPEYRLLRPGLTLFTYLHLAADKRLTEELLAKQVTAIAYETVQPSSGFLPLLYPMSEIAGCLAPQVGAHALLKAEGGRGVLLGGVGGVANARVVIIGAGVSGQNAANIALGMGADVTLLDTDLTKLRMSFWRYNNRVHGLASSQLVIEEQVRARPRHRFGTDPGSGRTQTRHERTRLANEARFGASRHRRRPGRLLRGHPADHPRRPDVPGAQLDVLLRGKHARRCPEHLHLCADERDPAVRAAPS